MQSSISERSHVLLMSTHGPYMTALRFSGRRGAISLSGAPCTCQNGTLTLWISAAFCGIYIPRVVCSAYTVCPVSYVCASGSSDVLHKTSCYVTQNHDFTYSVKSTDADIRKFKKLMQNWTLQITASFPELCCSWITLHAKIRVKRWLNRLPFTQWSVYQEDMN